MPDASLWVCTNCKSVSAGVIRPEQCGACDLTEPPDGCSYLWKPMQTGGVTFK